MVELIDDIGPNSSAYSSARGKGTFKFDEVNLFVKKSICFIPSLTVDLDVELSYAQIEQGISSFYSNSGASTSRKINSVSSYWGVRPQFSLGLDYRICYGLYFTGKLPALSI